jgi:hypothetical protein
MNVGLQQRSDAMNASEVQELINSGHIDREFHLTSFDDMLCIDGYVALPVIRVCEWTHISDIADVIDPKGDILGTLMLTSRLGLKNMSLFSDYQYLAYLTEISFEEFGASHQLRNDYFLIHKSNYRRYQLDFSSTAGIWGGFCHPDKPTTYPAINNPPRIQALLNIELPTIYHKDILFRAHKSASPFERYLHLYHLLELMFDWHIVQEIKSLNSDLEGIALILNRREKDEIYQLRWLISNNSIDIPRYAQHLSGIPLNLTSAKSVFYDFGKDSNPIKSLSDLIDISSSRFEKSTVAIKLGRKYNDDVEYQKFLVSVLSYWIYRVRCCIAHSRIGEYVFKSNSPDEQLVIEFMEPLIREVLIQVLTTTTRSP